MCWLTMLRKIGMLLRIALIILGVCWLSSCQSPLPGDYREAAAAGAAYDSPLENRAGLSPVVSGRDSENLFFCPDARGEWAMFASNRHSRNFKLYKKSLTRAGFLTTIPGGDVGNNFFPALHPDNNKVAFSSDREGGWRIYMLDLTSQSPVKALTTVEMDCLCPVWDPKGTDGRDRLAFTQYNPVRREWEICMLDLVSGGVTHLGPGFFPAWSPNGKYLAVQRERERGAGQFSLWLIRVDGSELPKELIMHEEWAAANPAWSPDGRYIVFNTVGQSIGGIRHNLSNEGGAIYYIDVQSGEKYGPLPGGDSHAWRPAWSPDGSIYFHQRAGHAINVYSVKGPRLNSPDALADSL